jgi:tetratricopeptide (TPR) repeat protein
VRVLVTSREAVGLRGERVFPLPPLERPDQGASPTAESLGAFESAQLFVDRAVALDPRFVVDDETAPVVAEICHQLDGWPLALELAAARTRQMSLHALRDRLSDHLGVLTGGPRDAPDRQRTLRETIAWSFDLLTGPEQQLLARLSVFRGGATLTAAEAVCRGGGKLPVLDGLASLLDKSLLRMDEQSRFQLLETVREFAAERLDAAGEAATVRTRHAHFYLGLYPEHVAGGPASEEFGTEIANVLAALEWLVETEPEQAARLFTAVQYRLVTHLHAGTAAQWGDRLEQLELSAEARARLDVCRGTREIASGERETAVATLSSAARRLLEAKDQVYALRACVNLAGTLPEMGRIPEATEWAELAREVSGWSDPPLFPATTLAVVALAARLSGDFERCIAICQEATSVEQPGDAAGLVDAWDELSRAYSALGRSDDAVRAARECLALARREGGPQMELYPYSSLGRALVMRGDLVEGAAHLVASLRIARLSGLLPFDLGWVAVALQMTAPESGALALGAHERMQEINSDPDQEVPAEHLEPVRDRYLAEHPDTVARGRRLGWPAVGVALEELDLPPIT